MSSMKFLMEDIRERAEANGVLDEANGSLAEISKGAGNFIVKMREFLIDIIQDHQPGSWEPRKSRPKRFRRRKTLRNR